MNTTRFPVLIAVVLIIFGLNASHVSAAISIGKSVQCTSNGVNVRSNPGTSASIVGTQNSGAQGVVLDGPQSASGYTWWKVNFSSGADGWMASTYLAEVAISVVATPVISPGSMSTTSPVSVTMSCATSGATIRYTTNGGDPTSGSTVYGGAFTLTSSATVKARAFKSGMADSAVASQSYTINIPSGPANNNFASRTAITAAGGTVAGSNVNATKETGEPNHAGNTGGKSVWWTWMPSASGTAVISTTGSGFDTVLGVYTGTSVGALTVRASDDDSGGNNTSRVSFSVTAGTAYQIAVDGYNGASGSISLTVTPPSSATPITQATAVTGINGTAGSMTYYRIDVPSGQTGLYVQIWNGTGNADLYVQQGSLPTLAGTPSNQKSVGTGNGHKVSVPSATAGTWYIMVHGSQAFSNVSLKAFTGNFPRIVLLLHGMNGEDPVSYWEGYLNPIGATQAAQRGQVTGIGTVTRIPTAVNGVLYYAMDFGTRDEDSGYPGFHVNAEGPAGNRFGDADPGQDEVSLNMFAERDRAGDFSDYDQLGDEVEDAVTALLARHPGARITLLAHSRGGLAARAFLQRAYSSQAKSAIDALVTLGTPHDGSNFGRVFEYLKKNPRNRAVANQNPTQAERDDDWATAERLVSNVYAGEPTVRMLANDSSEIDSLRNSIGNLPQTTRYGAVLFGEVDFGYVGFVWGSWENVFGNGGWVNLSDSCERYILYKSFNGAVGDTARAPHKGDGIVSLTSQDIRNLSEYPGYALETESATGVLHASEEVRQTTRIDNVMGRVKPW